MILDLSLLFGIKSKIMTNDSRSDVLSKIIAG